MKGIFLFIYLVGALFCFLISVYELTKEEGKFKFENIFISLAIALFSWFGIVVFVVDCYGDDEYKS